MRRFAFVLLGLALLPGAVLIAWSLWAFALTQAGYAGEPGTLIVGQCEKYTLDTGSAYRCSGAFVPDGAAVPAGTARIPQLSDPQAEGTRITVRRDGELARTESLSHLVLFIGLVCALSAITAVAGGYYLFEAVRGDDTADFGNGLGFGVLAGAVLLVVALAGAFALAFFG
ncbi:hypothetical protein CLV40_10573 [Actinokineospora auranticolor]|uniref:Uncharacterized protein n=2 Tax=Actinokineospora auranticolor TaxID=155976 RepID=A0A2S6GT19_9PSEU|nr:hypothetical protein CLV40_10573 [Actinokineospora auranticolor]